MPAKGQGSPSQARAAGVWGELSLWLNLKWTDPIRCEQMQALNGCWGSEGHREPHTQFREGVAAPAPALPGRPPTALLHQPPSGSGDLGTQPSCPRKKQDVKDSHPTTSIPA